MVLDTATSITFLALLSLVSGLVLFAVGRHAGASRTVLPWAFANLFVAVGVTLILEEKSYDLAFMCTLIAAALMWTSIVAFNDRPLPAAPLTAAGLIWIAVAIGPFDLTFGVKAAIYMTPTAAFLYLCAWELWRGRAEPLAARGPFLALVIVDATAVAVGAVSVIPLTGIDFQSSPSGVWPVYVTATVFSVLSTALLIALINQRTVLMHRRQADLDDLTGIANRAAVLRFGADRMSRMFDERRPIAVAMFDLDHFKAVNDTFGHRMGDLVLKQFARSARGVLRPTDEVGRIGGEEFMVVLPGVEERVALAVADRIRRTFATAAEWIEGRPVRATVSAGVTVGRRSEALQFEQLIDRADRALYVSKDNGRNSVSLSPDADILDSHIVRIA